MNIRSTLAPGYKKLNYAVFSGTQYIDTGIPGNTGSSLDIICTYEPNTSNQQCIFSARTDYNGGISFWTDGYCHFGNASAPIAGVSTSGKHTVRLNKTGLYWDNKKLNFTPGTSFQQANLVFGKIPSDNRAFTGKIYNFIVYFQSILVRNYFPAKRLSDNVVGFYDTVTKTFSTVSGSGTLTGTEANETYKIKGSTNNSQVFQPRTFFLPLEYQQVNYVKRTTGEAYIDTRFIPNYTKGFDIEINFRPINAGQRYCLAANYNQGNNQLSLEVNAANQARYWAGGDRVLLGTVSTASVNKAIFAYHNNTCKLTLNGAVSSAAYAISGQSTYSLWLFMDRAKRTSIYTNPLEIYWCRIYSGGTVVKNLVPCKRKSDGVVGFYDTVGKTFIPKGGSGTLITDLN